MAELENTISDGVLGELDRGDEATAQPSAEFVPLNATGETVDSINYAPGTAPFGGATMHGGDGTAPLAPGWELPRDNSKSLARARAAVKASEAATVLSLWQFARGGVATPGHVAGLDDNARTEKMTDKPNSGAFEQSHGIEGPSDESGMSIEDAATSAFDDHDRFHHGIAEGEREEIGCFLKGHADAAGTTVRDGLNALIAPAVALRYGNMETKRQVLGQMVDDYSVQPLPTAEPEQVLDEFGEPVHGGEVSAATEEAVASTVHEFTASHPGRDGP